VNRSGPLRTAFCASLCAHAALWLWAREVEPSIEPPSHSPIELSLADVPVQPPEPVPPQPTHAALVEPRVAARPRKLPTRSAPPSQAAPAAAVLARAAAPIDLTGETVVTGTGHAFVGGVTGSTGTAVGADAVGTRAALTDASSAISLESQAWFCPWPAEADAERIDEQTVVLRVVVGATGNAESASVVSDPGHGFGAAAVSCAMKTRFTPARDPQGTLMRAQSPPIRVRFTR
jgi:periplasmic protein TonB